jgi:hypothetical protein
MKDGLPGREGVKEDTHPESEGWRVQLQVREGLRRAIREARCVGCRSRWGRGEETK